MHNPACDDATHDPVRTIHPPDATRQAYLAAMLEERWDEGEAQLAEALDEDPTWVEGRTARGIALLNLGRREEAELELLRAIRLDPSNTAACFNLGWLYQTAGDHEQALSWYKNVVLQEPGDAEAMARMGECALALGRRRDAKAFLEEALRLVPHMLSPTLTLAQMHLEEERPAAAQDLLVRALGHHPDDIALRYTLALVLEVRGRYREALPHLHAVVTRDEHDDEALFHLGRCARRAGLGQEAEALLAQAVSLNPENVSAVYELGRYYAEQGKTHAAIGALEECLQLLEDRSARPHDLDEESAQDLMVGVLTSLGHCYEATGRHDLAREAWERSLAIDPRQKGVGEWLADIRSTDRRTSLLIR